MTRGRLCLGLIAAACTVVLLLAAPPAAPRSTESEAVPGLDTHAPNAPAEATGSAVAADSEAARVVVFDAVGTPKRSSATKYTAASGGACDASLPALGLEAGVGYSSVVVEVGTNLKAESSKLSVHDPADPKRRRAFITIDPLPAAAASGRGMGFAHRIVQAAIGPVCGSTKFFEDGALSGVLGNSDSDANHRGRWFSAPVVTLSAVLRPLQEALGLPVQMLIVDAQGFDLQVLRSAGAAQLANVGVIVHECQNLPLGHPELLAPTVDNCKNASSWLQGRDSPFRFGFCMHNMGNEELNCAYVNPTHPSVVAAIANQRRSSKMVEPFDGKALTPHAALLPFAQELWQIMCPSLTISHLFRSGCMLATIVWGDPRFNATAESGKPLGWLSEPLSGDQCAILRSMMGVMPADKMKRTGNTAALLACDTGRSLLHTFETMPKKKKHRSKRVGG